ncbi:hypothetical protein ONS95_011035 [Cadophora gregata]|uniref:uncharacterized protein n=1 Tax=Cadophora gregata TaxID=51156 RepID=UPI0026DB36F7|nr:uncharacterized protein ONS95_011035 [Cadophora gregata]KAK0119595.1 hypothetical protein ONS95_011035 [Cadophora gregata]
MVLKTVPASAHDAEEIGALMLSVSTSQRLTVEFANCKKQDRQAWTVNSIRSELAACEACGEDATALKVVETPPGKKEVIVGFAIWVWSEKAYTSIDCSRAANPLPEGIKLTLRQTFRSKMTKMERDHRPKGPCFVLEQLATAPSHQRRGIGAGLVRHGLEKADQQCMTCYLSGAPLGVPLYRKLGFEEVGKLEIPLSEFGGSGTHVHGKSDGWSTTDLGLRSDAVTVAMIRKPKMKTPKLLDARVQMAVHAAHADDAE